MLTYKVKAALAVIAVVFGAASFSVIGWQVRDWQAESAELTRLEAERKTAGLLIELADEIGSRTETAIGGIRVENKTIYQKVAHEVEKEVVYRDCRLTDNGLRDANEARRAANAAFGAVPAATPTE